MIQNPTMTAPIQQPVPFPACPIQKPAEFNAINISINGARVDAPAQPTYYPANTQTETAQPVPAPTQAGEQIDYKA